MWSDESSNWEWMAKLQQCLYFIPNFIFRAHDLNTSTFFFNQKLYITNVNERGQPKLVGAVFFLSCFNYFKCSRSECATNNIFSGLLDSSFNLHRKKYMYMCVYFIFMPFLNILKLRHLLSMTERSSKTPKSKESRMKVLKILAWFSCRELDYNSCITLPLYSMLMSYINSFLLEVFWNARQIKIYRIRILFFKICADNILTDCELYGAKTEDTFRRKWSLPFFDLAVRYCKKRNISFIQVPFLSWF